MIAASLTNRLADPSLVREQALLAGEWVDAAARIEVRNPSTGELLAEVADMALPDIRRAIVAADVAQRLWAEATGKERAAILRRWYDLVVANTDDLATILTAEMGKPLAEAKGEIAYGAGYIEWFGEEAKRIYGDTIPGHHRDKRIIVLKQPVGVVAGITPWNFPSAMVARKFAPALAAGCAMVFELSAETPLSALALISSLAQALVRRAPVVTASSISNVAVWRCGVLIMRPLRPPQIADAFFLRTSSAAGSSQCAVLVGKLAFQVLDPLLLFLRRLAQPGRAGAVPVIRQLVGHAPCLDLFREKPAPAAIICQIGLIHRDRFQHRRELVTRGPTFGASIGIRQ